MYVILFNQLDEKTQKALTNKKTKTTTKTPYDEATKESNRHFKKEFEFLPPKL